MNTSPTATGAITARPGPVRPVKKRVVGHVVARPAEAKGYEVALLTIWLTITLIPPFPGVTVMLYALVLYFISFLLLDAQRTWGAVYKSLIVLPLPLLGVLSMFWSPYPAAAFRLAILLFTSAMIVIIIGSRYSPKQVLRALMIAGMVGIGFSMLFIGTANTGGPFASKNYLAFHMLMGYLGCMAFVLEKDTSIFLKAPPALFAALAVLLIFLSEAVTSQLLLIGATLMMLVIRYFFVGTASLHGARTFVLLLGAIFTAIIILVATNLLDSNTLDNFLALFGKDSSLTGRTDLWAAGNEVVSDKPLGGVGLEGFWQYDVGAAQTLNENDSKPFGTKLSFHNAYLEVAVHLGLSGLLMFVLSVLWVVWKILSGFLARPTMVTGTFVVIMTICLISSMTESLLWGTFNTPASMYFVAGTLFSVWQRPRIVAALMSEPA